MRKSLLINLRDDVVDDDNDKWEGRVDQGKDRVVSRRCMYGKDDGRGLLRWWCWQSPFLILSVPMSYVCS